MSSNKFTQKIKKIIPSRRKIIQLYCAVLFNANLKGFSSGTIYKGSSKKMCVPGLNCYSCPGAIGACPLGSLQGSFSNNKSTIFYVFGILFLYAVIFGRMICGWMCPFGLIQELLYKIKTPKIKKSPVTRALSYFKYVILVFFVIIIPIMYAFRDTPLPAFCKYICPAGTLEGGIMLLSNKVNSGYFAMLGPIFTWKFLLMISIIVLCIFTFRMFCRFICPLGAIYGFFNRFSLFGIKLDESKCTHCNLCVNHCKMDIKHVGDHECISCGECVNICNAGAISFKGSKIFAGMKKGDDKSTKKKQLITRSIALVILVAILAAVIVHYWNDSKNTPTLPPDVSVDVGNEVGDKCYGLELDVMDETGMLEEVINPAETGKVTIINFWGTWCSGCVKELPYFDRIASEYKESVCVVAIHTNLIYDTAYEFIDTYYKDSDIVFAVDTEGEDYYTMLGGRGAYPMTVIVDADGVITNVFLEPLEYEDLKESVEAHI